MISAYLRIKKAEEQRLMEVSEEINRQRLDLKMGVIKESEILHQILKEAFAKLEVKDGQIVLNSPKS